MDESMWDTWHSLLSENLFEIAGEQINLYDILTVVAIIIATLLLSRLTRKAIRRGFEMRGVTDEGSIGVVTRLVHFAFLLIGLAVAVESAGIDLAALFAAGAVFAVAIGFAVQNIVQNFVSGVILLLERDIKPGDVIELDGRLVKVHKMGIRATEVRTLNEEDMIVPNSSLVQSTVKNYTLNDEEYRLRVTVGVAYESDMKLVLETLEDVARGMEFRLQNKDPVVLMTEFADSCVSFEISVWIDDPWRMRKLRSLLRQGIWWAFQDKDIVIAFPQMDVHLDPPVSEGLAGMGKAA